MSELVTPVTTDGFAQDVLGAGQLVVVDFWAAWCGPCRMVAPELDKMAAQLAERVKVVKVNVDEHPTLAGEYGVMSIPTLLFFDHGQIIGRHTGFAPAATLVAALEKYLAAAA